MAKRSMPGMGGGLNPNMLKQMQKMQQDIARTQEELENKEYSASAGGGAVSAAVNGQKKLLSLSLQPDVVDPEDIDMLQDLIVAAVSEAQRLAEEEMNETMGRLTGGLQMPF